MDDLKNTFPFGRSIYARGKQSEFIKRALDGIKSDDEMQVLNSLCDLSSELSMASDAVADDSNCQVLIKELIGLFDKFYGLPDISSKIFLFKNNSHVKFSILVSALTCINYLLDLNPRYTSTIIKWHGLGKIVNMTQNIEYIDCAENAIKAIEKMTHENPFALIENDAFSAILSLIDFFDLNLRKSALKSCVNMTKALNNFDYIKKYIFPAIPSLTNLTRYTGNSELEKSIVDLAVLCFYNIAHYVKMYNLALNQNNFCNQLIQYGLLDILYELFNKFLDTGKDIGKENNSSINLSKFSTNILQDTFKNILKLFEILSSLSADVSNLLLNMNILEVIYSILCKELGVNSNNFENHNKSEDSNINNIDNTKLQTQSQSQLIPNSPSKKISSNSTSYYLELFALLISFFPGKKSKGQDRLLCPSNKNYFLYFSDKILSLLINNVVNIPSSNTMVSLMKLLEMYIQNSPDEFIFTYIDPVKLSNIAGKMVDSKDSSYIIEVFNIVEVIMSKIPEQFFIPFLREGVVDHIKNLTEVDEGQLYFPQDTSISSKLNDYAYLKEKYAAAYANSGELFNDEEEFDDGPRNESENLDLLKEEYEYQINAHKTGKKEKEKFSQVFMQGENLLNIEKTEQSNTNVSNYIKNKVLQKSTGNSKTDYLKNLFESKFNTLDQQVPMIINNSNEQNPQSNNITSNNTNTSNLISTPTKKITYGNSLTSSIQLRAKEISEKYFTEEIITKLLIKTNSTVNPKEVMQKLINIKEILKNPKQVDLNVLTHLFDIMFDKNKITFYEIEKSEVLLYLTKFLDENFFSNFSLTTESEQKTTYSICGNYNKQILNNIRMLLYAMGNNLEKVKEFLKILQHCISSMNCFKLFLYDIGSLKNASHLFLSSFNNSSISKIKLKFVYSPETENIDKLLENGNPVFKEIYDYFLNKKSLSLTFDQNENFDQIKEALIKYRNKIREGNSGNASNSGNSVSGSFKDDYYEEIFSQLRNRKGSEEDIQLTEKLLQKLIDRKKSIENSGNLVSQANPENLVESNSDTKLIETESIGTSNLQDQELLKNLDINFFVVINSIRMDINKDRSVKDFFRDLKSFYKRSEYILFSTDMQINFDITHKNMSQNINEQISNNDQLNFYEINKIDPDSSFITLDIDKNQSIISQGNYENLLFENFYRDNIINNKSTYCIKRACPFIYLISLLELSINNFSQIFNISSSLSSVNDNAFSSLSQDILENLKMTSLLFKQVKDPYAISSQNVPSWCRDICQSFPYLAGFNSRYLLFKVQSFETKRAMTNLYVYLKNYMGENVLEDKTLNQSKRVKVKIDRTNIIRDAEKIMKDYQGFNGYLEFEYHDETGTGIGPTYEFYSLIAKEVKKINKFWYKTTDLSLYPAPIENCNLEEIKSIFTLLGFVIARGLYDDRLLDFPLNSLFWDLVLDRPINLQKIVKIDKDLGKAVQDFSKIIEEKKKVLLNPKFNNGKNYIDFNDYVKYNNTKIEDIGLTFTLPGYNRIELKRGGEEELVTINNIEEYLALLFEKIVLKIKDVVSPAFRNGFNLVFPIENLKCFTSSELEENICGCSSESWDSDTLIDNITPTHGYTKTSLIYTGLLEILSSMNNLEKKKFLLFVTGSPRLPLGGKIYYYFFIYFILLYFYFLGFKSLNPKMTVVKKQPELKYENQDEYLPTVMTCQNYLKIPEYSSTKVLREKLFLAMEEGGNAFHLS